MAAIMSLIPLSFFREDTDQFSISHPLHKNYSEKIKEGEDLPEPPDLFSIFQVDEENLTIIENKLLLYKNIAPSAIKDLPYWHFNRIVDDWIEDIDKQKAERKKQEDEYAKMQKNQRMPSSYKNPKMPSAPKW